MCVLAARRFLPPLPTHGKVCACYGGRLATIDEE